MCQPPTLDDIGGYWSTNSQSQSSSSPPSSQESDTVATPLVTGGRDKLLQFTNILFEDDKDNRWNPKVRELLVMTLLLRYDQFCTVLRRHPSALIPEAFKHFNPSDRRFDMDRSYDYNTIQDHLFVCRVERALEKAGVHQFQFQNWCKCARSAFIERNIISIPDLSLYGVTNKRVLMDPRCFVSHFNALSSMAQSTHQVVQQLRHQLNDMTEMMTQILELNHQQHHSQYFQKASIQRIENHLLGERTDAHQQPPFFVTKFTVSSKGITNQMSVADVFVSFFYENCRIGFELDKKSEAWKEDMDVPERKRYKNLFAKIKRSVRMILMHADSFPQLPDDDPSKYKEILRRTATAAEDHLRSKLGFAEKRNTIYTLTNLPEIKDMETSLKLPSNTPDSWRKFFKSD